MKKLTLLFAVALALISCNDRVIYPTDVDPSGAGALTLSLGASEETYVIETKADDNTIDLSEFGVEIIDSEGTVQVSYDSYTSMPDEVSLEAGIYTICAKNGSLKSAGFDSPWYYGEQKVAIAVGETTSSTVTCEICNVKLTIDYSDTFKENLTDVLVTVTSVYDNSNSTEPLSGVLRYTVDEDRAGWFAEPYNGQMSLYVRATTVSGGEDISLSTYITGVEARQWRKVNLDVQTSGDIDLEITIDDSVVEMPDVDITVPDDNDIIDNNGDDGNWEDNGGGEEPENPEPPVTSTEPTITGSALGTEESNAPFDIDQTVNYEVGVQTVLDILIESQAEGGIQNLYLSISSDTLDAILSGLFGITGEIDLANPTGEEGWYSTFSDDMIGIIDPDVPIAGKSAHTFSVGPLMELLGGLTGSEVTEHEFCLRVVDANGEESKTLYLSLTGIDY